MDKINVTMDGKEIVLEKKCLLNDVVVNHYKGSNPALAAYVNNEIYSLDKKLTEDCNIKVITYLDPVGNKIYQKGLTFLLVYAFKELYGGDYNVKLCHPIDKAIKVRTNYSLTEEDLLKLKQKMLEIVKMDMPIKRCLVKRRDAKKYFENIGNKSKADTFIYNTSHYVTLYKLGDLYDYFFSIMPYSTGVLDKFDLKYLNKNSFVFQFPTFDDNGEIPPYIERDKISKVFDYNYKLSKRIGIFNSVDFNKMVSDGKGNDIIKLTEVVSSCNLLGLAKMIDDSKEKIKVVLLAGPSASGKTTTSKKLAMYLKVFGFNPKYLSIDDYFVDREKTPLLPNGSYDFESIDAIKLDLFNDHLKRIISGEEIQIPTFNFFKGKGEYLGKTIKLEKKDILIIEGLHAINEKLTESIPKESKYKVYISPLSDLNIDDHNMISNTDVRLLRRIVRDNRTRGYSAESTIKKWQDVRTGETKNIFPFQNDVDFVFNSSFLYEIGVLKLFAEPLLYEIKPESSCYEEAIRLLNFLSLFVGIPDNEIPSDSIFREFIGDSYFDREVV